MSRVNVLARLEAARERRREVLRHKWLELAADGTLILRHAHYGREDGTAPPALAAHSPERRDVLLPVARLVRDLGPNVGAAYAPVGALGRRLREQVRRRGYGRVDGVGDLTTHGAGWCPVVRV